MQTDVITFAEGCKFLRISRSRAERHIRDENSDLPRPFRLAGRRYYRQRDLQAYIDRKADAALNAHHV